MEFVCARSVLLRCLASGSRDGCTLLCPRHQAILELSFQLGATYTAAEADNDPACSSAHAILSLRTCPSFERSKYARSTSLHASVEGPLEQKDTEKLGEGLRQAS